ncbi:hypothetical protein [Actinoplanes sp. TFC3]|uniref:hypothetical protein n=1 Tax=Actinoplanes sp. TFC3 TaxID=1710355 RepID=UPI00082A4C33|nr:hypothetical protein [Actinoplanes sp. TFC3]
MPELELHDDLQALAAHGTRVLKPRPVTAVIDRGRRRRRNQRLAGTAGLAAAVLGIAGGAFLVAGDHPRTVAPGIPPAAQPSASPGPLPSAVLAGREKVTLRLLSTGAAIVAGYDDDDRVIAEATEGKDAALRNRWLLRPAAGDSHQLVQVTKRPAGEVCAAVEDDQVLHIRICNAKDEAQQFTLTATQAGNGLTQGADPVRVGAGDGLTIAGTGAPAVFSVEP